MKALVASDTLLPYPDHNLPFDIKTDASDFQLGAIIKQKGRPVAYYTRKRNPAQRNYTTIKKELLSIVETLREFHSMLLGSTINMYTDHRKLTHRLSLFTTQRVLCWRILIEEFNPTFFYLPGSHNVVTDALRRLPISEAVHLNAVPSTTPIHHIRDPPASTLCETTLMESLAECLLAMPVCDAQWTDSPHNDVARDDVTTHDSQREAFPTRSAFDAYLFHPKFDPQGRHSFHFSTIHHYQQQDKQLLALHHNNPERFFFQTLGDHKILCIHLTQASDPTWRICLPDAMLIPLVQWYHEHTVHSTSMDHLEQLICRHFHHPGIRAAVRTVVSTCLVCPQVCLVAPQHGQLAPRDASITPWSKVHVDYIGPWSVKVNSQELKFDALTMIEPVTNLLEVVRLQGPKNGANTKCLSRTTGLPAILDPSRLFMMVALNSKIMTFSSILIMQAFPRFSFLRTLQQPTASLKLFTAVSVRWSILSFTYSPPPPTTPEEADMLVDNALATAMYAHRCSPNTSLGFYSPGALVFQCDMLLDIPLIADIHTLTQNQQALIDKCLLQANHRRTRHEFKVNDQVFIKVHDCPNKLSLVHISPFPIIQVHTNNTVTVQRGPVQECLSI